MAVTKVAATSQNPAAWLTPERAGEAGGRVGEGRGERCSSEAPANKRRGVNCRNTVTSAAFQGAGGGDGSHRFGSIAGL